MNNYTDKLDNLLKHYDFEELSDEAKKFVESKMSISEYSQFRKIAIATQELNDSVTPTLPKNLHSNLKQSFRLRNSSSYASRTVKYLVPLLGLFLGALGMAYWNSLGDKNTPEPSPIIKETIIVDTVYVPKLDTLYIASKPEIKIITKEVIKYIEKEITKEAPTTSIALNNLSPNTSAIESQYQSKYVNNIDLVSFLPSKVGTTIGEETELMGLLEEMPSNSFKE